MTGGGPNVAANVQAGKTNSQTVGTTNNNNPTVSLRPNSRVDKIDQSSSNNRADNVESQTINEVPLWMILVLVLLAGLIIPSPFTFKFFKSGD